MEGGKTAYLGLGFSDRADSFDVNTTLHDHFKGIKVRLLQDCVSLVVTSLPFPLPFTFVLPTHNIPVALPTLETLLLCI